jgi:hypothetical protein
MAGTPRRLSRGWIVVLVAVPLVLLAAGITAIVIVLRSGVTRPIDNMFGDQHLKTAVALIELHKVRHGEYPPALSELEFLGEWDRLHVTMVAYCPAGDRQSYFLEVQRGWAAKPELTMPPEFWRGTGFRSSLGPCR